MKSNNSIKGLSGICNLGNTCYMNSALQIVLGINELNEYLVNIKTGRDNENTIILKEWVDLYNIMSSDNVIVKPDGFLKYLQRFLKLRIMNYFLDLIKTTPLSSFISLSIVFTKVLKI